MSQEREFYIQDIIEPRTSATRGFRGQGRVRVANTAENALKRYLSDAYKIRNSLRSTKPFVPKKSYNVFLLSNPIEIAVTPIQEEPFTLEIVCQCTANHYCGHIERVSS